jgi:hypothetical protein
MFSDFFSAFILLTLFDFYNVPKSSVFSFISKCYLKFVTVMWKYSKSALFLYSLSFYTHLPGEAVFYFNESLFKNIFISDIISTKIRVPCIFSHSTYFIRVFLNNKFFSIKITRLPFINVG